MAAGRDRAVAAVGAGMALLGLAACAPDRNIDVTNNAESDVSVRFEVGATRDRVSAGGGLSVLDVTRCYDGPVEVAYTDGRRVELDEQLCPGDLLAVSERGARLVRETDREAAVG